MTEKDPGFEMRSVISKALDKVYLEKADLGTTLLPIYKCEKLTDEEKIRSANYVISVYSDALKDAQEK